MMTKVDISDAIPVTSRHDVQPVFLLSLPRSGSTLLQRILAGSPSIDTVAEPWICLPLARMTDPLSMASDYWHGTCQIALEDAIKELPNGLDDYHSLVGEFVKAFYAKLRRKPGSKMFLDKTPRYYLIVAFLAQAFPNAKFIFLYRNPLDVMFSILRTWHRNWISHNLLKSYIDLARGPQLLAEGPAIVGQRGYSMNFEDLVARPESSLQGLCDFLEIEFTTEMLTQQHLINLEGRMGDPATGQRQDYVKATSSTNAPEPINLYRRWYARRFVRSLNNETLAAFGLSRAQLLNQINAMPLDLLRTLPDAAGHLTMTVWRLLNHLAVRCLRSRSNWKRPLLPYG